MCRKASSIQLHGRIWSYMATYGPYMAIYCNAWQYMTIWTIYGHMWTTFGPYMPTHGFIWAIRGHKWSYMAMYGPIWPCMVISGHSWPYMTMCGPYIQSSENLPHVKIEDQIVEHALDDPLSRGRRIYMCIYIYIYMFIPQTKASA